MKVISRLVVYIKCYVNMLSLDRENLRFMCTVNRYVKIRFEGVNDGKRMVKWLDKVKRYFG